MKRPFSAIVILAIFLCGCAKESPTSDKEKTAEPGIIDYITGAERLRTYKRTESKVKDIDKTLKERFQGF